MFREALAARNVSVRVMSDNRGVGTLPNRPPLELGLGSLVWLQTMGNLGLTLRDGSPLSNVFGPGADLALAGGLVLLASLALATPLPRPLRASTAASLASVMLLITAIETTRFGHFASWVAPLAHAIRFVAPAALAGLLWGASARAVSLGLRVGAGAVFIGHGIECLLGHPTFIAYLTRVPRDWLGFGPSAELAGSLLTGIGVLDIVVGAALLVRAPRPVLAWTGFWGLLTALVRVLYLGLVGWPDALIRITNGGVPALLLRAGAARLFRCEEPAESRP